MPNRVIGALLLILARPSREMLVIFINRLGNDIKIELLRGARLGKIKERQTFWRGVFQPIFDRNSIPFSLGNFLAFFIEEKLIYKLDRWITAKDFTNLRIKRCVILMILTEHFKIDAKGGPAHPEIRFPLQFHITAGDRQSDFRAVFVLKCNRARFGVGGFHRYIKHTAGCRADRQERRIGGAALFAEGRQHHLHDVIEFLEGF